MSPCLLSRLTQTERQRVYEEVYSHWDCRIYRAARGQWPLWLAWAW
jgi:hypothetical protein